MRPLPWTSFGLGLALTLGSCESGPCFDHETLRSVSPDGRVAVAYECNRGNATTGYSYTVMIFPDSLRARRFRPAPVMADSLGAELWSSYSIQPWSLAWDDSTRVLRIQVQRVEWAEFSDRAHFGPEQFGWTAQVEIVNHPPMH